MEKIAPSVATPSEPPIERNSVAPEVATPRSEYSTAFCTASTSTCITIPSPNPSTNMNTKISPRLLVESIVESRYRPSVITAVPAIGKAL